MRQLMILIIVMLGMTGCRKTAAIQQQDGRQTQEDVLSDMANIDEIELCEEIIQDSTLMDAEGERGWKKAGKGMIRIKNNGKYYLRMETEEGAVTSITYRYDK